ncbi:MAG: serine hydrolase [Acidobacteria bacterium]|nr:serine hydrolase [Acidobacteriota bacterium]
MIRRFATTGIALSCLALTLPATAQQAVGTLSRDIPTLMQQTDIPGLSIALLQNGRIAWVHSFGTVDPATGEPVTDRTRFSAASLSKTVFAYAILQLVDQGKLDLDTPLTHYWGERVVDPANDPRLDKITARIVLSHRTGFRNWRGDDGKLKIFFNPGERFSYSGEGYVYLQHTIEHIEGKSLNDIVQQLVFTPLGMNDSTYISVPGPNITLGYTAGGQQRTPIRSDEGNAAASLLTTAHDYALFLEAILSGRNLKPVTLRQMETAQIAVDPTCTNCTDHAPAKLSTNLFWGLGWGIEQATTGKYLWHWGDNGAFKAFVSVDLKRRNAVVFFANSSNGLSIAPAIVHDALGGDHPAFAWIKYDTYDSLNVRFIHNTVHSGAQTLTTYAPQLKSNAIAEETINSAGYFLLKQKKYDDAIAVFNRCIELHPNSDNAYNNLGDTYAETGKTDLAIKNYQRALELEPTRGDTKSALAKLQSTGTKTEAAH